jgi:hypothetical protein
MREIRNSYKILVRKPEWKRPLGISRHRWEDKKGAGTWAGEANGFEVVAMWPSTIVLPAVEHYSQKQNPKPNLRTCIQQVLKVRLSVSLLKR